MKERIQPDLQSVVMKPETADQLAAMMSRVVEEGTGTAAALSRGSPWPGRPEPPRWGRTASSPSRGSSASRPWRTRGWRWRSRSSARQGQGGTVAAPIAKSRAARRCSAEAADDRGGRQHGRRRPLPGAAPHRLRRHGGRVLRRGHAPRPAGRAQGAPPPLRPGPGVRRALPPRGEVGRRPEPPERRRRVRPRRARGHLLHRDGVPGGADPQGHRHRRGAAARRSA